MKRLLIAAFLLLAVPTAQAQTEPAQAAIAERVHGEAFEAAKRSQWKKALRLWQDALELNALGKYALNACIVLDVGLKRPVRAWDFCARAAHLGLTDEGNKKLFDQTIAKLARRLVRKHARITLTVAPTDATVTRNGAPWPLPRDTWVRTSSSQITVSAPGHEPKSLVWEHPTGNQHERTVRLESSRAVLHVEGPAGATLQIGGKTVGTFPLSGPIRLEPGRYQLRAAQKGFETWKEVIDVKARQRVTRTAVLKRVIKAPRVRVEASPATPTVVSTSPDDDDSLAITGWTVLASGIASAAGGAGLWSWATTVETDLNDLANDPDRILQMGDAESYNAYYDRRNEKRKNLDLGGTILIAAGGALVATGIVLLVVDATDDEADPAATSLDWRVSPLVSTPGVSLHLGF